MYTPKTLRILNNNHLQISFNKLNLVNLPTQLNFINKNLQCDILDSGSSTDEYNEKQARKASNFDKLIPLKNASEEQKSDNNKSKESPNPEPELVRTRKRGNTSSPDKSFSPSKLKRIADQPITKANGKRKFLKVFKVEENHKEQLEIRKSAFMQIYLRKIGIEALDDNPEYFNNDLLLDFDKNQYNFSLVRNKKFFEQDIKPKLKSI